MVAPDLSSEKPALSPFKPTFNVFIPLLRLIATLACLIVMLLAFTQIIEDFTVKALKDPDFYMLAIPMSFMLYIFITFSVPFLTRTKNYTFSETFVKEYNFLTLSNTYYDKDEIMGFSTCKISSKYQLHEVVTIYLHNGKHINLQQFAYFNYSEIATALYDRGYEYWGEEQYVGKILWGRYYQF